MSKKKTGIEIDDYDNIDKMCSTFNDFYGEGAATDANYSHSEYIPTEILPLDLMIPYGGIPQGRVVMLKAPEGAGKCLHKDTYCLTDKGIQTVEEIFVENGVKLEQKEIFVEKEILLANEDNNLERVSHFYSNGKEDVVKVISSNGQEIVGTPNHPIRVIHKGMIVWKKLKDITTEDYVVISRNTKQFGKKNSPRLATLLGYLIADGYLGSKNLIGFTNNDEEILQEFEDLVSDYIPKELAKYPRGNTVETSIYSKKLRTLFFNKYGIDYVLAKNKTVPKLVRLGNRKTQINFIRAYMELESSINTNKGVIEVTSASKKLLEEIQLMLLNMGVISVLSAKKVKNYPNNDYWRILISGVEVDKYLNIIGYKTKKRLLVVNKLRLVERNTNIDSIPKLATLLEVLDNCRLSNKKSTTRIIYDYKKGNAAVTYSRLKLIIDEYNQQQLTKKGKKIVQYLVNLYQKGYFYSKVNKISHSRDFTYDFTLPNTHTFISNGFISHNTSLLLHIIGAFQRSKILNNRETSGYSDCEFRFDKSYANLCGTSTKPGEVRLLHGLWGEANLEMAEHLMRSGKLKILGVDSVPALVPREEVEGAMDDAQVGLQARMIGKALRKLIPVAYSTGTTIIFTNQIREKIGVTWGSNESLPGGRSLRHYSDLILDIRKVDTFTKNPTIRNKVRTIKYGQRCKIKIAKGLGGEGRECFVNLYYGQGINEYANIVDIVEDYGIFKKSGQTYMRNKEKIGTYNTAMKKLEEDSKFKEEIIKEIWEVHNEYGI